MVPCATVKVLPIYAISSRDGHVSSTVLYPRYYSVTPTNRKSDFSDFSFFFIVFFFFLTFVYFKYRRVYFESLGPEALKQLIYDYLYV